MGALILGVALGSTFGLVNFFACYYLLWRELTAAIILFIYVFIIEFVLLIYSYNIVLSFFICFFFSVRSYSYCLIMDMHQLILFLGEVASSFILLFESRFN